MRSARSISNMDRVRRQSEREWNSSAAFGVRQDELERVSQPFEPGGYGVQDDAAAVVEVVLVVPGGDAAPLFAALEAAFNDVAALVIIGVESWRTPARAAAAPAVAHLIVGLGDDRLDVPGSQQFADRPRRVGLVAAHPVRSGPGPARPTARDPKMPDQDRQHRRVPGLAGSADDHQRQSAPVDQMVDLGAQPPA